MVNLQEIKTQSNLALSIFLPFLTLTLSFSANGQELEKKNTINESNYELGYVQKGQEKFCQMILEDYEEYSPGNMDEYYKSEKFVQWTSGLSSASRQ